MNCYNHRTCHCYNPFYFYKHPNDGKTYFIFKAFIFSLQAAGIDVSFLVQGKIKSFNNHADQRLVFFNFINKIYFYAVFKKIKSFYVKINLDL
jgi:hypothetical protein